MHRTKHIKVGVERNCDNESRHGMAHHKNTQHLLQIIASRHKGLFFLEAFILTSRPDVFVEERNAWLVANPRGEEEYRNWFLESFEREPPGLRETSN